MFKGFYNLTSAMLTHQSNLNVVANNLVNVSTAGYKQDRYTATTFDDVMYARVGTNFSEGQEIGRQSYIRATSEIYTDYTQGTMEPTGLSLDFGIVGDGFFAVQNPDGEVHYTRMGNFTLDDDGYLCLPGFGQVLGPDQNPIYLGTDKINCNGTLVHTDRGLFEGEGAELSQDCEIWGGYLERSNSDVVKQMTEMITYQRALQSAAQISKMYDQLMSRAATDVGRMQ